MILYALLAPLIIMTVVLYVRSGTRAIGGLTRPLPPSVVAGPSGNDVTLPAAQNGATVRLLLYADGVFLASVQAGATYNHAAGTGSTAYTAVERTATTQSIASPSATRGEGGTSLTDRSGDPILDRSGNPIQTR